MKKALALLCLLSTVCLTFAGCGKTTLPSASATATAAATGNVSATATPAATQVPADITEKTDYKTQQWIAAEIPFTAKAEVTDIQEAEMDVTFTNRSTSTKMVMPAFWDGGTTWKVRFAPTEYGIWDYQVTCKGTVDLGLAGKKGTLACNAYKGNLDIYKHGFVKTVSGTRYFVYDDGTPFFYLGDTHWAMLQEEYDKAGSAAAGIETISHFKYIVDRRVAQKFTVYQSEPLGSKFDATNGIKKGDIAGFQLCDKYFAYIAEKGLVHANAELIFPSSINQNFFNNDYLYQVTRYWVARYAAYPVLWTLGQEIDNDFFGNNGITVANNPYQQMCKIIYQLDPYRHPITGHQENAMICGAKGGSISYSTTSGEGVKISNISEQSVFFGTKEHTWWGVQWRPDIDKQINFSIPMDYWYTGEDKVSINYETRYDYLYTKNFGARANGWISFLNGMYGYGYGAADIWCYQSTYSFDKPTSDGIDTVTTEEKAMPWGKAILMPTGDQLTYMRGFFESVGWWKLIPDFNKGACFKQTGEKKSYYSAAYDGNNVYVVYLYNKTTNSDGMLVNMDDTATYTAQWFNPRTGVYTLIDQAVKPSSGSYNLPVKPEADDMVLLVTKNS